MPNWLKQGMLVLIGGIGGALINAYIQGEVVASKVEGLHRDIVNVNIAVSDSKEETQKLRSVMIGMHPDTYKDFVAASETLKIISPTDLGQLQVLEDDGDWRAMAVKYDTSVEQLEKVVVINANLPIN